MGYEFEKALKGVPLYLYSPFTSNKYFASWNTFTMTHPKTGQLSNNSLSIFEYPEKLSIIKCIIITKIHHS